MGGGRSLDGWGSRLRGAREASDVTAHTVQCTEQTHRGQEAHSTVTHIAAYDGTHTCPNSTTADVSLWPLPQVPKRTGAHFSGRSPLVYLLPPTDTTHSQKPVLVPQSLTPKTLTMHRTRCQETQVQVLALQLSDWETLGKSCHLWATVSSSVQWDHEEKEEEESTYSWDKQRGLKKALCES